MIEKMKRREIIKYLMGLPLLLSLIPNKILYAAGQKIVQKDGIFKIKGIVKLNGAIAKEGVLVKNGDRIVTGPKSFVIFVAQRSVYKLRPNTDMEFKAQLENNRAPVHIIGLIRGGILSVFPPGLRKSINTRTASIGIRGSGAYAQIDGDKTYFCLCYGEADIKFPGEKKISKTIKTRHHESPFYILPDKKIKNAIMKDHSDKELMLLESLVGRDVPFDEDDDYMDGY